MTMFRAKNNGFTLLELCAVLCILAILATIALLAYSKFSRSKYDNEAIASLHSLYNQASILISDWGVGEDNSQNFSVSAGCLAWTAARGMKVGQDGIGVAWDSPDAWKDLGLSLDGTQHWAYQICFGFLNDANGKMEVHNEDGEVEYKEVPTNVEGFIIAAYREVGDGTRVVLYGSGLEEPLIDVDCVPNGAALTKVKFGEVLNTPLDTCP